MRATSVSPETSLLASRVSETVRTAMRTGMNAMLSSRRGVGIAYDSISGQDRCRRHCAGNWICGRRGVIDRPLAGCSFVEALCITPHTATVHPMIRHHAFHIGARLGDWHALDEEQG